MLLLDRNHLSVYAPPGRHTRAIIERNLDDGRPTEIATAIGTEPALQIATQARVPLGMDEFAVAGGLRGAPCTSSARARWTWKRPRTPRSSSRGGPFRASPAPTARSGSIPAPTAP